MSETCFPKNNPMLSVQEALKVLLSHAHCQLDTQTIPIEASLGRIVAQDVRSVLHIPPQDNTAMDGYTFNGADFDGSPLPISGRICAGDVVTPLMTGTAVQIFTGAQIPIGADTVVPEEITEVIGTQVEIFGKPIAGQYIRRQGEDVKIGDIVLKKGKSIRAQEMGLLAALGQSTVVVYQRLKVAIFSTGNELVNPDKTLKVGQIYNSNRYTLLGLLQSLPIEVLDFGIVADDFQATQKMLQQTSAQADLIISNGGVSVGQEDHIKAALASIGQLMMWKVRMKPGKPLAFGKIGQAFFMGLPGNPVSVFAVFNLFVRPFITQQIGQIPSPLLQYQQTSGFDWLKTGDRREYLRAKVVDNEVIIYPNQSSGVLSSTSWAQGFCVIMEGTTIKKGDPITFIPFSQWH